MRIILLPSPSVFHLFLDIPISFLFLCLAVCTNKRVLLLPSINSTSDTNDKTFGPRFVMVQPGPGCQTGANVFSRPFFYPSEKDLWTIFFSIDSQRNFEKVPKVSNRSIEIKCALPEPGVCGRVKPSKYVLAVPVEWVSKTRIALKHFDVRSHFVVKNKT